MTRSEIVKKLEAYIPTGILKVYRTSKRYIIWKQRQRDYAKAIKLIRQKTTPLKIVFIVNDSSGWKYDSVYKMMDQDVDFEPMILVCPLVSHYSESQATDIFHHTFSFFSEKGYRVMKACDKVYDESIGVDELKPDLIFYSSLWTDYIHPKYNEKSLRKYLKGYVNYGFSNTIDSWGYASAFHGLMWRYFAECEDIRTIALQVQPREMQNMVVTGYPIYDEYQSAVGDDSMWKNADKKYKRIIWAPHHSIEGHDGLLKLSTFLEIAEEMLAFAESHHDLFQFVFKPHPLLKQALYDHPNWGKKKTEDYYEHWKNGINTSLVTGTYIDLFKSSDAMIHDCGSFIIEYLYSQKPVMYLGGNRENQSNGVGRKAYECHYHGLNIEEVKTFLFDVVIGGKDPMKDKRKLFYNNMLLPPNGCTAAENILNEIKKELRK